MSVLSLLLYAWALVGGVEEAKFRPVPHLLLSDADFFTMTAVATTTGGTILVGDVYQTKDSKELPHSGITKVLDDGETDWSLIIASDNIRLTSVISSSGGSIYCGGVLTTSISLKPRRVPLILKCSSDGLLIKSVALSFADDINTTTLSELADGSINIAATVTATGASRVIATIGVLDTALQISQMSVIQSSTPITGVVSNGYVVGQLNNLFFTTSINNTILLVGFDTAATTHFSRSFLSGGQQLTLGGVVYRIDGSIAVNANMVSNATSIATCGLFQINPSGKLVNAFSLQTATDEIGTSISRAYGPSIILAAKGKPSQSPGRVFLLDSNNNITQCIRMGLFEGREMVPYVTSIVDNILPITGIVKDTSELRFQTFWGIMSPTLECCQFLHASATKQEELFTENDATQYQVAKVAIDTVAVEIQFSGSLINETVSMCERIPQTVVMSTDRPLVTLKNVVQINEPLHLRLSDIPQGDYRLSLCTINGNTVYQERRDIQGPEEISIPTTGLVSSIYFIELQDANSFATVWRGKVVIE